MKTALIIGDSHVEPAGSFGPALARLLEAQGYDVTLAGVGSTNASQWANQQVVCRPDKSRCVDQSQLPHDVDLLVISLGTNDAANAAAGGVGVSSSVAAIKRIVAQYSPDKYFWIGPPATKDTVAFYTNAAVANYYAAARASSLRIFDSRPVTSQHLATGDGVHLYGTGANAWAAAAANGIKSQTNLMPKIAFGLATASVLAILWRKGYI